MDTNQFKKQEKKKRAANVSRGIMFTVIGVLFVIPWIYDSWIMGHEYHYIEFIPIMYLIMFGTGIAGLIAGLLLLFVKGNNASGSTMELDVARIRFTTETQAIINNNKPQGK
jgi:hypothetical protein